MVSSSGRKRKDVGANLKKSSVTHQPGRFYLDVKNHLTYSKLETKIKELGGNLELFLVKEVTHVITDREFGSACANSSKGGGFYHPRTPQTPNNENPSSVSEYGTPETKARSRPKTRADAMLEKARQRDSVADTLKDPLVQAKKWGITIWTVDETLKYFETPSVKVYNIKAPYLKIEAFDRKHRPIFKEIKYFPVFNFDGKPGSWCLDHNAPSPPPSKKSVAVVGHQADLNVVIGSTMTKKFRDSAAPVVVPPVTAVVTVQQQQPQVPKSKATETPARLKPGYCEVCQAEYLQLESHLGSEKHQKFIGDNANFIELDSLINDGSNVENFLKLNTNCANGLESTNCNTPLTHKMPKTRTHSTTDRNRNKRTSSPIEGSEEDSEKGTPKRVNKMTNSYLDPEDASNIEIDDIKGYGLRRSSQRVAIQAQKESDTWDSGRPKRACIRRFNSYADPIILTPRSYYRVEKNHTTDTKRPETPLPEKDDNNEADDDDDDDDDKPLVLKIRKIRSSELRNLNNDAETFLFPPKRDSSGDEDEGDPDGTLPDTTCSTVKNESTVLLTSESEKEEEVRQVESPLKSKRGRPRLKSKSSSEAGAGTRNGGGELSTVVHDESIEEQVCAKVGASGSVRTKKDKQFSLDDIKFSFECVPKSEPWYAPFTRQDEGEEWYTCFSDSGYWKPFLLPYELAPIPPLDPKVCMNTYLSLKKQLTDNLSSGTNSGGTTTPTVRDSCQPSPTTVQDDSNDTQSTSTSTNQEPAAPVAVVNPARPIKRKKSREERMKLNDVLSKNPRKSPRQHASTLAILSSLIQQRKKREANKSRGSLEPIAENESDAGEEPTVSKVPDPTNSDEIIRSIDELLDVDIDVDGIEKIELSEDVIDIRCQPNAVEILADYENLKHDAHKTGLISQCRKSYSPGCKPGRKKKKKNLTGWPKVVRNRHSKKESTPQASDVYSGLDQSVNISESVPVQNGHDRVSEDYVSDEDDDDDVDDDDVVPNKRNATKRGSSSRRWDRKKVLAAKSLTPNDVNTDFQPIVRVQKLDRESLKRARQSSSSSPSHRTTKRARRMPASPKSPRVLRKPRGRWYRER